MNSDDPRAQRTRARLKAAVLELAAHQELATITMSALAKRAEVNRATVYLHYPDVHALVTDAMEDAVAAVARAAALCPLDAPRDRAPEPLCELFEHVAANATLYERMLGPHGSARFAARMRERLTTELTTRFTTGHRPLGWDDVPMDVHAAYLAGALVGVIAHWVTGDGSREPGVGNCEPGDGKQEPGVGKREPGDGKQELGDSKRELGDGKQELGDGRPEPVQRPPATDTAALAFWRLFRTGCQPTALNT